MGLRVLAEVEGDGVRPRPGQVWEDQAKRVYLVLESTPAEPLEDDESELVSHHTCLRLSAGNLTGSIVELPEFSSTMWERIFTRHQ